MKKQKELPIKDFLQSEKYESLKLENFERLNNNNLLFNTKLGLFDSKAPSNLIDFKERQRIFKKTNDEKLMLKTIKKEFKSKAFNIVAKIKSERDLIIEQLLTFVKNQNTNFKIQIQ